MPLRPWEANHYFEVKTGRFQSRTGWVSHFDQKTGSRHVHLPSEVSIPNGMGFISLKESIPEVQQMRKGLYRAMRHLSSVANIRAW